MSDIPLCSKAIADTVIKQYMQVPDGKTISAYQFYVQEITHHLDQIKLNPNKFYYEEWRYHGVGPRPDNCVLFYDIAIKIILAHIFNKINHHNQLRYNVNFDQPDYHTYFKLSYYPGGWDYFNISNRRVIPIQSNYNKICRPYLEQPNEYLYELALFTLSSEDRLIDETNRVRSKIKTLINVTQRTLLYFTGLEFGPTPDIELVANITKDEFCLVNKGQLKYQIQIIDNCPVLEVNYYPDGYGLYE